MSSKKKQKTWALESYQTFILEIDFDSLRAGERRVGLTAELSWWAFALCFLYLVLQSDKNKVKLTSNNLIIALLVQLFKLYIDVSFGFIYEKHT